MKRRQAWFESRAARRHGRYALCRFLTAFLNSARTSCLATWPALISSSIASYVALRVHRNDGKFSTRVPILLSVKVQIMPNILEYFPKYFPVLHQSTEDTPKSICKIRSCFSRISDTWMKPSSDNSSNDNSDNESHVSSGYARRICNDEE